MNHFFIPFLLLLSVSSTAYAQKEKLNIIVFIADDVSWDDLGCYGNTQVKTPNIDQLARDGLKFDNFYLTASSCSPSRNSIITGRYPHNTGAAELHTTPPLNMVSFPELLRNNNYYSVMAGKFHMGPYARRGFDMMFEHRKENGDGGEESWLNSLKKRPKTKPFFMW
ncbi:MAG: sulfatase-like hydrolase/transferase, partial [Arenibacter algicola]|nr:sulfatase-like hydrolase/transferase [Arenibacter algicola]